MRKLIRSTCYSLSARRCISITEDNMMDGRACNQQPVRENEISERMIHHLRMPLIRIRMLSRQLSRYVALENRNHVKFQLVSTGVDHIQCHRSYFRHYGLIWIDINARRRVSISARFEHPLV